mgnify:CR=1 FL=1
MIHKHESFVTFYQIRQEHPDEWKLRSSKRYKTTRLLEQLELIARTATFESAAFITAPEVIKLEFLRLFAFERLFYYTVPSV